MVDPDEMSVASDDEEVMSAIAAEEGDAELHPDSDGEDAADEEPPDSDNGDDAAAPADEEEEVEEESADAVPQADNDEDEDDDAIPQPDSDNEEEKEKEKEAQKAAQEDAQKKPKPQTKGIMRHFHVKQQGSSGEKAGPSKSAEAAKPPSATVRPKGGKAAAAAAQPVALGQNGGTKGGKAKAVERAQKPAASAAPTKKAKEAAKATAPKSGEAKQPAPQSDFSYQDSEEEVEMTMPQNKGVPLAAPPDAEQEYEDLHKGGGESARGTTSASTPQEAPQVAELAKKRRYVLKNEKTKRWAEWLPKGLLYAPECSALFAFGLDDLTIQSKKDRIAAQTKLADSEMDKIMQTLCVSSFTADAAGSGSGPGITNLMAGVPSELPLQDKELNDLMERLQKREPLADDVEVVLLHVLDHDIMKRIYKVSNAPAPLPGMYNPNTNPSNKFKVPSQVEKAKETDDNFIDLGIIETNKRQRTLKRTGEERPNGQKPEGKRPATGVATSATNGVPGEIPGKEAVGPGEYSDTFFKGFHDEEHAISYAKLTCKENEVFTVLKCSSGKWLLLKSIEE